MSRLSSARILSVMSLVVTMLGDGGCEGGGGMRVKVWYCTCSWLMSHLSSECPLSVMSLVVTMLWGVGV